jgi:hypothetical protein
MFTIRYECRDCGRRWSRRFPPTRPFQVALQVDGSLVSVPGRVAPCCKPQPK